jgi:molybdopterin-guanine dinucleotide biosynthesis protein A
MNAYILIGGRSRRMGASKTALFLERVIAAAAPVFDEVVAVQRSGGEAARIRTIFEEPHDDEAPLFGVACALRDAGARCFVLAVDYPLISSEVLRHLRDDGRVPLWDGQPQLLCAVWDVGALPRIEARMARRQFDLRGLIDREMIAESELRARFGGEPLRNVNTPEEWQEAMKLYG